MKKIKLFSIFTLSFYLFFIFNSNVWGVSDDTLNVYNSCEKYSDFPIYSKSLRQYKYSSDIKLPDITSISQNKAGVIEFLNAYYLNLSTPMPERVISDASNYYFITHLSGSSDGVMSKVVFYLLPKDIDYTKCTNISNTDSTYTLGFSASEIENLKANSYHLYFQYCFSGTNKGKGLWHAYGSALDTLTGNEINDFFSINISGIYSSETTLGLSDGTILFEQNYFDDVEIGDSSSRLKLSYEYNEDYTECKINATLENGAFTDKIFYSNYMPSIAGQGLLSKQAFPTDGITVTENQSLFFQAEDKDR